MQSVLLFALPWLSLLAAEATPGPASPAALVECERAFARSVAATGIRAGFLEWLAPTGVVFRPGPVNGPAAYAESPASAARLAWEPEFAAVSAAGDLGWTTGPWAWRADSSATEDAAWGEYLSVWRRQDDGRYLAVLDVGISHAGPSGPPRAPEFLSPAAAPRTGRGPLDRRRSLWKADADFGRFAEQSGVAAALERFGAERLVLLREGLPRVLGRAAAADTLRARERAPALMSLAQFLSDSGDLGYTYGSFVTGGGAGPDSGYYVNVWHRGTAKPWELAAQLVQPAPRPKE